MKEWVDIDCYNPFNSMKLLAWVDYWRPIADGQIPAPVAVSVDPTHRCNQACRWCNAAMVLSQAGSTDEPAQRGHSMSRDYLLSLADFLADWGVRAVCVGGGGESLVNEHTGAFITRCVAKGVQVGVVTNGELIDRHVDALSECRWVGVSVDAASAETYASLHGTRPETFEKVIENIRSLRERAAARRDFEIGFKFLVHPDNVHEVHAAAKLAKTLGVARFHCRPVSDPWFDRQRRPVFSEETIGRLAEEMRRAYELHDREFKVYAITHKVTEDFDVRHRFGRCHAIFMTCVFEPDGTVSLCCDRRGDARLELCRVQEPRDLLEHWGSSKHKAVAKLIHLEDCPRCTFAPHNEIFEQVIENDSMMLNFI